jgi:hypothetical protein
LTPRLHSSLLQFWPKDWSGRTVAGTGFLVSGADGRAYALTCGHVANVALGRRLDETSPLSSGTVAVDLIGRSAPDLELVSAVSRCVV